MTTDFEAEARLLDRPYAQRQFIMVVDDAIIERNRLRKQLEEVEAKLGRAPDTGDWAALAASVVGLAFPAARIAALGIAGYEVAKRAIQAWGRVSQSVDVHLVSVSEAEVVTFPPGHPQVDVLYVGHPAVPSRYTIPADFHRVVFEHKFSEAVTLLMALGATTIEVHHVAGWSRDFIGNMAMGLPLAGTIGAVGAEAESGASRLESLLLKADLETDETRNPSLPSDLVWYPSEPLWEAVAKGRIEHGLTRCQLAVRYTDDFHVNADLHSTIVGNGKEPALKIGGAWNDHTSTVWRIDAVFGGNRGQAQRSRAGSRLEEPAISCRDGG